MAARWYTLTPARYHFCVANNILINAKSLGLFGFYAGIAGVTKRLIAGLSTISYGNRETQTR
ncbi:hypothetical protein CC78DRAFT_224755 [Lojkania enalia]|uniref:Uncharacterized protein n=1 Tax=Lojkania enalia TaxID=147567 RepID=A0A9P4KA71_9PLEO|nr:hypothetical protein CC78DRAFT_224755 [Didymosphaeria enalia]